MVQAFRSPTESLRGLDAGAVATLLAVAADVALVLDGEGVVRDMALGSEALARDLGGDPRWLGQPWAESVAEDSRDKVAALLRDANSGHAPRWRHVNHPSPTEDASVPVLYAAVGLGPDAAGGGGERIIAFGRDQRLVASLHQRLVEAQGSLERDYARLRHAEARYRLLFQMSAEPALVLDGAGQRVLEANPAADRLDGAPAKGWGGRPFLDAFDRASQTELASVLAEARFAGRPAEGRGRLSRGDREEVTVAASPFRQEGAALLLVRLLVGGEASDARRGVQGAAQATDTPASATARAHLLRLAEAAPDGFVVAGGDGRIVAANPAFLAMAQLGAEEDALGESLDRWLGRPGLEAEVLLANLRTRGAVRLFPTTLRGEHGTLVEAEVSATPLGPPDEPAATRPPLYGFAIRDVGARMGKPAPAGPPLPRPVEQLTELVGRVPLKDLVREATDVIERLAIEAALELAEDNRASAAEMLGLSRQSLYVKLRRYGLGGDAPAGAGADEG